MKTLFGTFQQDVDFLVNKFRHPVYPEQKALSNDDIMKILEDREDPASSEPSERLKAEAFEFICQNMQIDVNPHDWFPSFGCWNRNRKPMNGMLNKRTAFWWEHRVPVELNEEHRNGMAIGAMKLWLDTDHSIPDWAFLMKNGFQGVLTRVEDYFEKHESAGTMDDQKRLYFEGVLRTYKAILKTLDRFCQFGQERYPESGRVKTVCDCLEHLKTGAPRNFLEALEFIYLYFMFSEYIDRYQVRSLGNLDVMLYPFFQRDLENGTFTEAEIRELLDYFMMQWGSIDNYWGQPFYMGGTNRDGSSRVNPLSAIILQEYDKLNIPSPKIQIKVNENTPDAFLKQALDMIRRARSGIVFINERAIEKDMLVLGRTPEETADPDITGCYEWGTKGDENIMQAIHCNVLKMVELAMNDGCDPRLAIQFGPHTGKAEDLQTFSDFYAAFLQQLTFCVNEIVKINDFLEQGLRYVSPSQMLSGTIETSLKKGQDAFSTGSKYNSTMMLLVGIGTTVDALMAVKEFVFDKKMVSLPEMRDICRNNWQGHEKLRRMILKSPNKYGNAVPSVDYYAQILSGYLANLLNMRPNCRGGYYMASSHPARQFIEMARCTGATPDGRLAGEEASKNMTPTVGMDKNGITAMIQSVTSIDSSLLPGNFTLDVMIHPTSIQGADGLDAICGLMRVYFKRGGNAIQFNVFDSEELKKAQREPERYKNLQVRICGWNARFVDLCKQEQDCYIKRAEEIIE